MPIVRSEDFFYPVDPGCKNEELLHKFVPGSLMKGIFSYASFVPVLNANNAEKSR
jgi:hypothetical protein